MTRRAGPLAGVLVLLVGIVLSSPGAHAAPAAGAALKPPSTHVTSEGRAAVYGEDLSGARDRAVAAALLRAVETWAGLRIESSTLIKKGELIDREIRTSARAFVKSYDVVDSRQDGTEMVVKVKAVIASAPMEEAFRRFVSSTTTLLLVSESNLDRPVDGQIVPALLADTFFTSKVTVPPAATLKSAAGKVPASFFGAPDPATAKELGLRNLAGLVLVVSAKTRKLDSSPDSLGYEVDAKVLRPVVAAEGNVTVLSGEDGRVIASRRFDDVRASDASDPVRAGAKALTDLGTRMKSFVVEKVTEHQLAAGQKLGVTVVGPAADGGAARARQILEATRWVKRVEVAKEEPGRVVLSITCVERPFYVVEEMRHAPGITVVRYDAARGEVEVK